MVPRTEAGFLSANAAIEDALAGALESGRSRWPVFEDQHDNVVGFVHLRDSAAETVSADDIIRPMRWPPETRSVESLGDMRAGGGHTAAIIDEYGGLGGIVTLEDLIEEIVGDIRDEYDPRPTTSTDGQVEVDGLLRETSKTRAGSP